MSLAERVKVIAQALKVDGYYEDLEKVEAAISIIAQYVAYRNESDYERAVGAVKLLNKLSEKVGLDKFYDGDFSDYDGIREFMSDFVMDIFANRNQ
ncbi:DUF3232 domain-containing protein [Carboxydothermus hydrogenoformans]|uniref:Conserved domain protein n=1 Tax=Carboxydothermus hydrogenoformans (strain ATCC BAA-161 / DSM 6008 / Z-2901) TaxID=246194 RepID=Q3ACK6_CARHZ|nr:DUF3232 domain-containing protein [Carboxydothermus hydrogenoformans]ABB14058.1 conserved domain protein [Carboxydothermus hydrogenoformans Z-2901]